MRVWWGKEQRRASGWHIASNQASGIGRVSPHNSHGVVSHRMVWHGMAWHRVMHSIHRRASRKWVGRRH